MAASHDWTPYLANGISVPKGAAAPTRQPLSKLSAEEMYLYAEGLIRFQNVPMNDPLSYFQIAGIHGLPYQTWPFLNDAEIPSKNKGRFQGFCTHNSILFLTWHRPYLALFESTLYQHVNAIARGISDSNPDKPRYIEAAKSFRMPYWDWAEYRKSTVFPPNALENRIFWSGPASNAIDPKVAKYNPLFQAPFQDGVDPAITMRDERGRQFKTTIRYPGDPKAFEDLNNAVRSFWDTPGISNPTTDEKNLSERVAYILLSYNRYDSMSFNRLLGEPKDPLVRRGGWGSLEDIHNSVHGLIGGDGGHMGGFSTSAFDPIFWLHHANIDRLFAIWQALHEGDKNAKDWITPYKAGVGNMTIDRNNEENADTLLYPFKSSATSWYTSNMTRRTETFGYSYPETKGLKYPVADKTKLIKQIFNYYHNLPTMIRQSKAGVETAGDHLLPQVELFKQLSSEQLPATNQAMTQVLAQLPEPQVLLQKSLEPSKPFIKDLAPNWEYLEWLVDIKAQRHALGGNYSVHIFLGPVEEQNVALWSASPFHVGDFSPLGRPSDTGCENCRDQQEAQLEVTGQIPLTIALVERYLAQIEPKVDLTPETVIPFLQKNLHWRVAQNGRVLDDRSAVAGLTVFVISNRVVVPENELELPIYDDETTIHYEVTTKEDGTEGRGDGTGLTAST